ncbi:unnamed protein product [Protopolystoma xenopodis]|uniref:Uncharacterized protein n=1 Tax=Protopolystoma xenopodis TaxID=117903 RepID=A0A3S5FGD6_9PLAT|nr:unnamed protein product [Protopolystoma xenopodis]
MTDESLAPFHRNRRKSARKQRHHECSSKANRQMVKRNKLSSSGGIDPLISSPNTFSRHGNELNNTQTLFAQLECRSTRDLDTSFQSGPDYQTFLKVFSQIPRAA